MKISQRPSLRSFAAATASTAFIAAPAALALWMASLHAAWGTTLSVVLFVAAVYAEDRWLLGALKRWVWSQHVRLTLHLDDREDFDSPFLLEKGAKFKAADGTVYESVEDAPVPIGATKTEVTVRRITP